MSHVLHRVARLVDASKKRRDTSRKLDAVLRDPHLAKDIGIPHERLIIQKPDLW